MNTIAHEAGHLYITGAMGGSEWYAGPSFDTLDDAYRSLDHHVSEDNESPTRLFDFYGTADAYSCSVLAFQGGCQ